jgi:hypothetical protein
MKKTDYWFLDLAIEIPTSFSLIIPYDRSEVLDIYRTPLDLTLDQIIETMHRLFQDGYLLAITPMNLSSLDTPLISNLSAKGFTPSRRLIKSAFQQEENLCTEEDLYQEFRDGDLFYFLTEKGGKLWETVSKPKWNQFFRRGSLEWEFMPKFIQNQSPHLNNDTIWCADRDIGTQIIKIEHLLDYPEYVPYPIVGTEKWETITPWHPTYWKTLSSGFAVNYQVEYIELDQNVEYLNESQDFINQRKNAREWYKNIAGWYKNYYKTY